MLFLALNMFPMGKSIDRNQYNALIVKTESEETGQKRKQKCYIFCGNPVKQFVRVRKHWGVHVHQYQKNWKGIAMEYIDFLRSKHRKVEASGFEKPRDTMNPLAFEWQKDIVFWALKKGRAALFEDCGLGKTLQQLEWSQSVCDHTGKSVIIVAPLAVAEQTKREGEKFGYDVCVCRTQDDVRNGINITNYEMLSHFDAAVFGGVVLDESSILKNFTSKLRTQIIETFRETPYKLSCTATPSPNDYMELGNQAEFLGVMSRTEMLATYFIHDGANTSKWRLKGHAESRFWEWVAEWAVVLTSPADLGYTADGYDLPEIETTEHLVEPEINSMDGNMTLFTKTAQTLSERREARRNSLHERCTEAAQIVETDDGQWLVWCDLNDESSLLKKIIPGAVEIRGSDAPKDKADRLRGFTNGDIRILVTKPSIAGFGLNWQGCHNMIFVGLSDSYEMMYQAIRRCYRFGQEHTVHVHIVTSTAEGAVRENIERKERQRAEMTAEMVKHTKEILRKEIRGTVRDVVDYNPQVEMVVPEWLIA